MIATSIVVTAAITRREVHPMLLVDCPLCDTPTPFDLEDASLDCPACAVRLELAADEAVPLAEAA